MSLLIYQLYNKLIFKSKRISAHALPKLNFNNNVGQKTCDKLYTAYIVVTFMVGVCTMKEYIEKFQHKMSSRSKSKHQRRNTKDTGNNFFRKLFPQQESGQSRDSYMRQNLMLSVKYGALALAALAILRGGYTVISENVTTSNSVDGRELPIYCVETDEKKIALSFDAAWGNGR